MPGQRVTNAYYCNLGVGLALNFIVAKLTEKLPYSGIIWDLDGTLLDSNDAHAKAFAQAFDLYHYPVTFESVRRRIGMGGDKVLSELIGVSQASEIGEKILKAKNDIFFDQYYPEIKPFPRAKELLEVLHAKEIKLAVGTSGSQEECKKFLDRIGIRSLVQEIVTSDDAGESKPDPDIISEALKRLKLPLSEVVMVGDTPYDIIAAKRAGISCIAFRSGGWKDKDLGDAVAIYDGPADFLDLACKPSVP